MFKVHQSSDFCVEPLQNRSNEGSVSMPCLNCRRSNPKTFYDGPIAAGSAQTHEDVLVIKQWSGKKT